MSTEEPKFSQRREALLAEYQALHTKLVEHLLERTYQLAQDMKADDASAEVTRGAQLEDAVEDVDGRLLRICRVLRGQT